VAEPRPPAAGDPPDPGESAEMRAVKLIGGGRCLAHAGGATWMVSGALPGELLLVGVVGRRGRVVEGEALEVLADPHFARLAEPCPHSPACGGCDWPHVAPGPGAELKRGVAGEAAARHPELAGRLAVAPVTASPPAYRLRNRLHWDPQTRAIGFYRHRSWQVSRIDHCRIVSPTLAGLLPGLARALGASCPEPVDVETVEGDDGVVAALRPSPRGPSVIAASWLPDPVAGLGLAGLHRLSADGDLAHGWGLDRVIMALPIALEVPIGSFFQGNRHLVPWLFETVAALVGAGDEPVFDLHAGVGFLAAAARVAGRSELIVVEVHAPAAAAARRNLPGVRVVSDTAERFVAGSSGLPARAVVITDPPRTGLTGRLRRDLAGWRPRRIVMLGCDPATWSRDAAELIGAGYRVVHLELVDLFPFTHHVEVLAVLEAE
jgi:tRNA/tmRNA/rRNA uracil-C5-methylase (TrmA/RlmC/RlmD family)